MQNELDDVKNQYRYMHKRKASFRGFSVLDHSATIGRLINETGSKSILDYGCGKGWQYKKRNIHKEWGVNFPYCYDPGVQEYATLAARVFDGVICSDVIEHIPPDYVETVLQDIFDHAGKFVFMSVATEAARKILPDGRNVHLTVMPEAWWRDLIETLRPSNVRVELFFDNKPRKPRDPEKYRAKFEERKKRAQSRARRTKSGRTAN